MDTWTQTKSSEGNIVATEQKMVYPGQVANNKAGKVPLSALRRENPYRLKLIIKVTHQHGGSTPAHGTDSMGFDCFDIQERRQGVSIVERSQINRAKPQASRTATLKHLGSIIKPHVPRANFALKGIPTGKWPFSEAWHLTGHEQAVKESLMYRRGSIYVPEFSPILPKPRYTAAQPSHDAGLAPMRTSAREPYAKHRKRLKENDSCRTLGPAGPHRDSGSRGYRDVEIWAQQKWPMLAGRLGVLTLLVWVGHESTSLFRYLTGLWMQRGKSQSGPGGQLQNPQTAKDCGHISLLYSEATWARFNS
ncbi:hypothetical protein FQN53_001747 [Emmonsiellopsis sp. PD_33]|nr:hypothetical protein FQN53_001747 [Emmonsiellopsis sp. PD_33]